jgi:hypothetical protein
MVWPFEAKNFRNVERISEAFIGTRGWRVEAGAEARQSCNGRR